MSQKEIDHGCLDDVPEIRILLQKRNNCFIFVVKCEIAEQDSLLRRIPVVNMRNSGHTSHVMEIYGSKSAVLTVKEP